MHLNVQKLLFLSTHIDKMSFLRAELKKKKKDQEKNSEFEKLKEQNENVEGKKFNYCTYSFPPYR